MDIQFKCPRTGQKLCVEEKGAGMLLTSPTCVGEVSVPQRPPFAVSPVQSTKRLLILAVGAILLLLCVAFYFTPHFAVHRMQKAAKNNDSAALLDYVDYPALRKSLKANINAMIAKEVARREEGSALKAIGAALAAAMINHLVDTLVTPEGVAMMMNGELPQLEESRSWTLAKPPSEIEESMGYEGLNRFEVGVKEKGSAEDAVVLVFQKRGIISWKLSTLRLPVKA